MFKKSSRTLGMALLLVGFGTCALADLFNLDVTFTDGGHAVGSFTTDATDLSITTWNFSITGSSVPAHNFTSSNGNGGWIIKTSGFSDGPPAGTVEELTFDSTGFNSYSVYYLGSLLSAGGSVTLKGALDCDGTCYSPSGGSITDTTRQSEAAVPEPSAVILFGTVLGIVGITEYRRRKRMPTS